MPRSCESPTLSSERRRRFAKGDCLRRSPSAWLSVCSATLVLLAGCGGGDGSEESQRLDPAVAARLADESDAVADAIAANDGCEAARRVATLRASLEQASVPDGVRREVGRYANRTFTCLPPAPAPPPPLPPPPPPVASTSTSEEDDDDHGEGKRKGHRKEKKDKKHGHDDGGDD